MERKTPYNIGNLQLFLILILNCDFMNQKLF